MSHWYLEADGSPQHFLGKDGSPTTLREARKWAKMGKKLLPSVTGVLGIVSKPALVNWIAEESAMEGGRTVLHLIKNYFKNDEDSIILDREWARGVCAASREKTFEKAKAGTEIHDILEGFFKGNGYEPKNEDMCHAVDSLLSKHCGVRDWIPEATVVSKEYGYAGKVDLYSEGTGDWEEGFRRGGWLIDFKSKDEVNDKTRGFPEQGQQLSAYRRALAENRRINPNARIANIFISRSDGAVCFYEHKNPDYAWDCFLATLRMWQVHKKYGVYWESLNAN